MTRAAAALLPTLLIALVFGGKAATADGVAVFARCRVCHTVEADGPNGAGPNLHGLFGRTAGSVPGFNYSEAMKKSGVVWNEESLTKYLHEPRAFIPGDRMAFPGIKDDKQLAELIDYLKQVTK